MSTEHWRSDAGIESRSIRSKSCPIIALATTNTTRIGLDFDFQLHMSSQTLAVNRQVSYNSGRSLQYTQAIDMVVSMFRQDSDEVVSHGGIIFSLTFSFISCFKINKNNDYNRR